jgi:isocitrate/isopropylmalate dehydrogenase
MAEGDVLTPDMGGTATTAEVGTKVVESLKQMK